MSLNSPIDAIAPPRARGANAVRRAATREKLLKASVECLAKYGYHATSTVMVAECAGVSRGAMLHQFPTKLDLMIATAKHISDSFGEARRPLLKPIDDPRKRFRLLLDIMWEETRSPAGIALLLIMMATRNDPELAKRLGEQRGAIDHTRSENLWRLGQRLGVQEKHKPLIDAMVTLDVAALRGLSVSAMFMGTPEAIEAGFALLKRYRELLLDSLTAEANAQENG